MLLTLSGCFESDSPLLNFQQRIYP